MRSIWAGTTLRMLASDEPLISQLSITSQSAIPWRSRSARLAAMDSPRVTGRSAAPTPHALEPPAAAIRPHPSPRSRQPHRRTPPPSRGLLTHRRTLQPPQGRQPHHRAPPPNHGDHQPPAPPHSAEQAPPTHAAITRQKTVLRVAVEKRVRPREYRRKRPRAQVPARAPVKHRLKAVLDMLILGHIPSHLPRQKKLDSRCECIFWEPSVQPLKTSCMHRQSAC